MGTIKYIFIGIFFLGFLNSCNLLGIHNLFDKGYKNKNGQYTPKRPRFKLKDKTHNTIPDKLDSFFVYKHLETFFKGKIQTDDEYSSEKKLQHYLKFYTNGRCLSIVINVIDKLGNQNTLKENDLNPDNSYCRKCYYYSENGKEVLVENFIRGEGYGRYITSTFTLNAKGDTLIFDNKKGTKEIFIKETIPLNWKKFNFD